MVEGKLVAMMLSFWKLAFEASGSDRDFDLVIVALGEKDILYINGNQFRIDYLK